MKKLILSFAAAIAMSPMFAIAHEKVSNLCACTIEDGTTSTMIHFPVSKDGDDNVTLSPFWTVRGPIEKYRGKPCGQRGFILGQKDGVTVIAEGPLKKNVGIYSECFVLHCDEHSGNCYVE